MSWDDAQKYLTWLSRETGKQYRLLSEAEYEYAARAGKETAYPWGNAVKLNGNAMADCSDCASPWDDRQTAPVGRFTANGFGLYDMVGNVWEWVEDCYHPCYEIGASPSKVEAPANGSPWIDSQCSAACCPRRFVGLRPAISALRGPRQEFLFLPGQRLGVPRRADACWTLSAESGHQYRLATALVRPSAISAMASLTLLRPCKAAYAFF